MYYVVVLGNITFFFILFFSRRWIFYILVGDKFNIFGYVLRCNYKCCNVIKISKYLNFFFVYFLEIYIWLFIMGIGLYSCIC